MKTPRVVVANAGKHHAYHTAVALAQGNMLAALHTTIYFRPAKIRDSVLPFVSPSMLKKIQSRSELRLDQSRVHSHAFPELLERLLRRLPTHAWVPHHYLAYNAVFDREVSRTLQDCDVFHGYDGCALASMMCAKERGAFTVIDQRTLHPAAWFRLLRAEYDKYGCHFRHPDEPLLQRKLAEYNLADRILVPSESVYHSFVEEGISRDKLVLNPYGVSLDRFFPTKRSGDTFKILYVGAVSYHKGVHYLLEAFRQLRAPKSELLLIGDVWDGFGPMLKKYEGEFKHISYLPQTELAEHYRSASVFVMPSLGEGSSLACYEALACGAPMIVTCNSGTVVRDGLDGFVVPIGSAEALAQKLDLLYRDPGLRLRMGESAAGRAREFTWEAYGCRLREFYQTQMEG